MEIIIGREGTQKTPISDQTVSRRHCKVTANNDGTYIIENLSPNGTKVDGVTIIRTTARPESRIQLGNSYVSTLAGLIGTPISSSAHKPQVAPSPTKNTNAYQSQPTAQKKEVKTFNISHLRRVWDDFNNVNIEMAEQQRKINLVRTGFGIFTMCAMPTIFFFGAVGYVLTGIGVLGNIYSFVGMKNSETAAERQERKDNFELEWVCPNPECRKPLPPRSYRVFVNTYKECPYCKCKYVER